MKNIILTLVVVFLSSCGGSTYIEADYYFEGKFEPSLVNVNALEEQLNKIAKEQGYRLFEKNRNQMKKLTDDNEAFFIALYQKNNDKLILSITNVGVGSVLILDLYTNEDFTKQDAKSLSEKLIQYLQTELNVEMKPIDHSSENKQGQSFIRK
jgi:hypothetical protein